MYVNKGFYGRIDGVSRDESDIIAKYCFDLINNNMDIQCRFRWEKGSIAIWDNRCTWHSGMFLGFSLSEPFLTPQLCSTTTKSEPVIEHHPLEKSHTWIPIRSTSQKR
jgi:hypothetical protein